MRLSALRLEDFFVEELHIKANREYKRGVNAQDDFQLAFERSKFSQQADGSVAFALRLHVLMNKQDAQLRTAKYLVDAWFFGRFVIVHGTEDALRDSLVQFNAPSLLLGVARGVLAQETCSFPWGRIILPTANLLTDAQPKGEPGAPAAGAPAAGALVAGAPVAGAPVAGARLRRHRPKRKSPH